MPIAEHIACMECTETAVLQQPLGPDDVLQAGDVLVYRCPSCGQRWDVVVENEDLEPGTGAPDTGI